jgi:Na+/H+ antiporter NhaD/arsenite permease-like protein
MKQRAPGGVEWSRIKRRAGRLLLLHGGNAYRKRFGSSTGLVSNVPAVLVLKPFITGLSDPQHAWLVIAMASTLAGNFTLVGSAANLIVAQRARSRGVTFGFWAYFKVGAPLTVLTILFGIWWL